MPPADAVMVAIVDVVTVLVRTAKVVDFDPAWITTGLDTVAFALFELTATVTSTAVTPLSETVAVDVAPPVTLVGDRLSALSDGVVTVIEPVFITPPADAVIETLLDAAIGFVVTANVADVAPAATVTEAGTAAVAGAALCRVTVHPAVGAGLPRVTVPVAETPPTTIDGEIESAAATGALIVSTAFREVPPAVAVIVADVLAATGVEPIWNVAELAPDGTVIDAGTLAAALLLCNWTTVPAVGAGLVSVIVPVDDAPPYKEDGDTVRSMTAGGVTVSVAAFVTPSVPAIVMRVVVPTADVVTRKVAVFDPALTVTDAGATATAGLLLVSVTTEPPAGAGPERVTVPVGEAPP
jgi:hypothetical protein